MDRTPPPPIRIAYAGTAQFGALVLNEILARDTVQVGLVITRPDKPRGRHGSPQPSPVKQAACEAVIPVLQPERLADRAIDEVLAFAPDVLVVCAFGEIITVSLLRRLETIVVHPSAVPRWRGAAPVARALMAGETRLGVATLKMTPGIDEGPVGDLRYVDVPADADAGHAYELLAPAAAESVLAVLAGLADGTVEWREQHGEPSYADKIEQSDRVIDADRTAAEIVNQVRALSPAIGARVHVGDREIIVWKARVADEVSASVAGGRAPADCEESPDSRDGDRAAGREPTLLVSPRGDRLLLAAADRPVEIVELQAPGGKRMTARAYLQGAGRWLAG